MTTHRLAKYRTDDPFTRIPNTAITAGLSLKTLGLLVFMLSKPDGWRFTERGLLSQLGCGRHALATAMDELIDRGYVRRVVWMEGNMRRYRTDLRDDPRLDFPSTELPEHAETEALSNKGTEVTNKADDEVGAVAPVTTDVEPDLSGKQTSTSSTAASKDKGKRVERSITDDSYAARLLERLGDSAPDLDGERMADNYMALFLAAKKAGDDLHGVAIGLTLGLLVKTFGPLPGQARGMLARLAKSAGPTALMQAAVTTAGSTVGSDLKYADDPLGPVRYLAGVARGGR